ncbi:MAG: peptidoglycan DD-metalloendopeptidase family protein [Rhodospirillaceae bacterium]
MMGSNRIGIIGAVLVAGWLAVGPGLAAAPNFGPPDLTLKKLEHDLSSGRDRQGRLERQSSTLKADLQALRERLITASNAATRQQAQLGDIVAALARYEIEELEQTAKLAGQRHEIAELVGALYRLALTPPEALIVRPEAPIDAVRTASLLRQAVPALRLRADILTASLDRLRELRRRLKADRDEAEATRSALAARHADIAAMVAARESLARETDAERQLNNQRLAALAAQATDLRQLFERLEIDRKAEALRRAEAERLNPAPVVEPLRNETVQPAVEPLRNETVQPLSQRQSSEESGRRDGEHLAAIVPDQERKPPDPTSDRSMRLPLAGRIVLAYGDLDRYGVTSRGLRIVAQPGTPVVAPANGTIKFAGRFRNYGQILIVEHSNGYHSLIAGLGRIDTAAGRSVFAGEPIGVVADQTDGLSELYFELRRNGQAINPQRGIPALDGKGQG